MKFLTALTAVVLTFAVLFALVSLVFMVAWNVFMPAIGQPQIDFYNAMGATGLLVLIRQIFVFGRQPKPNALYPSFGGTTDPKAVAKLLEEMKKQPLQVSK